MVRIWSVDIRYSYGYIHILQEDFYYKSEKNDLEKRINKL